MPWTTSLLLTAALGAPAAEPEAPAATTFADVIREIASSPEALKKLREALRDDPTAPLPLTAGQAKVLASAVLHRDWDRLRHFPTVTVEELGQAFRGADKVPARPGKAPGADAENEPLGIPVEKARAESRQPQRLAANLTHGEVIDPAKKARYADSERLADVLNRLSLNEPGAKAAYSVTVAKQTVAAPDDLLRALVATGHRVVVQDARCLANFAKLRYKDRDVVAPLWIDTQIPVPGKDKGYTLRIPACHCEHDVLVSGPVVNAEVRYYLGSDGVHFRPAGVAIPEWVGRRVVNEYRDKEALEAVRLAGAVIRAYTSKAGGEAPLPFGGYFVLGVCLDSNAYLEYSLKKGRTTLYPLTRELERFKGDGEIDRLARKMAVHRKQRPTADELLGSLPDEKYLRRAFPQVQKEVEEVLAELRRQP
jgi:hypothetical protein